MKENIKLIYLYLVSLIALIIIVINAGLLINLALKSWVFTEADKVYDYYRAPEVVNDEKGIEEIKVDEQARRQAERQRDASRSIAYLLVASPIFYYHWKLARKHS